MSGEALRLRSLLRKSRLLTNCAFLAQNLVSTVLPAQIKVTAQLPRESTRMAMMVRVKDEARFLPEWVLHHRALGFDHFYIYDNGSDDGIEAVLAPLIEEGFVTRIEWSRRPISPSAELHFFAEFASGYDWVAFFDADEFLVESSPGRLAKTLRASADVPGIALNWRYYGSSGHTQVPDGLLTENFTMADRKLDSHIKVIVQPRYVRRYRTPHNFYYRGGRLARTVSGTRALASFAVPGDAENPHLTLNHYVYRSRDDYARKVRRGYATGHGAADRARRESRIETEYLKHNEAERVPSADVLFALEQSLIDLGYREPYVTRQARAD